MRTGICFLWLVLALCVVRGTGMAADADKPAARLIILANSRDADSVKLADYYASKREVPKENIIALPMPADETVDWRTFIDSIYQPLQDELIKRGWIDAMASDLTDKLGRKKYAVSGHRISYLVVCRGVPLRIGHDQGMLMQFPVNALRDQFKTNAAAVDSELSLVVRSGYSINALIDNPLFKNDHPSSLQESSVLKVTRLDGPTLADAMGLIDHALVAESTGLIGRAYVDIGGPHPQGDDWLNQVVRQIEDSGFDTSVDRDGSTLPISARFDMPVLYFGWYAGEICGPFLNPGFRFPPGAIALHIHSFSAQTLRSDQKGWCGPFVARGVTATFGNVYEPYLPFTHHPHYLFKALSRGDTLGDAAYYALPVLSWQAVVIGDPLYRPFAVSFADQWSKRDQQSDESYAYLVLRQANLLEHSNQFEKAIALLEDALTTHRSPILALKLTELYLGSAKTDQAWAVIESYVTQVPVTGEQMTLLAEAMKVFEKSAQFSRVVEISKVLLKSTGLRREQLIQYLDMASKAAEAVQNTELAEKWKHEAANLR